MTEKPTSAWSCKRGDSSFPVYATVVGVAGCFAESILKKHMTVGTGFEIAVALMQAVPFVIVVRYFAAWLSRSTGAASARNLR